jgi:hypothetical protein
MRTVDDARGHRFLAHGWASEIGQPAAEQTTETVTLTTHNAAMGQGAKHG